MKGQTKWDITGCCWPSSTSTAERDAHTITRYVHRRWVVLGSPTKLHAAISHQTTCSHLKDYYVTHCYPRACISVTRNVGRSSAKYKYRHASENNSEKPNQRYLPRPPFATACAVALRKGYPRACISVTMNNTATFSALNDGQCLCHPFTDREMLRQPKAHQGTFTRN